MRRVILRRVRRVKRVHVTKPETGRIKPVDNTFNTSVLGLGDINVPSRAIESIVAVFDLAGFAKFCNQVNQQLEIPKYLSQFLEWLFSKVKTGLPNKSYSDRKALRAEPPFFAKFLGDGVLFLWSTRDMSETLICNNIVATLHEICEAYKHEFYPQIIRTVTKPPHILRCGIARGRVFSVGNGKDYIGHCINIASRLQKLGPLTFCFPHRGFDVKRYMDEDHRQHFIEKRVSIMGIGENELVWVLKEEFDKSA